MPKWDPGKSTLHAASSNTSHPTRAHTHTHTHTHNKSINPIHTHKDMNTASNQHRHSYTVIWCSSNCCRKKAKACVHNVTPVVVWRVAPAGWLLYIEIKSFLTLLVPRTFPHFKRIFLTFVRLTYIKPYIWTQHVQKPYTWKMHVHIIHLTAIWKQMVGRTTFLLTLIYSLFHTQAKKK